MELKPFKELIALSKEKLDEALAPIRARQVKAKTEIEMSKIETELLTKETQVQEMCAERDIDLPKLMHTLDEIAILERRRDQYRKVRAQLFPEDVKDAA